MKSQQCIHSDSKSVCLMSSRWWSQMMEFGRKLRKKRRYVNNQSHKYSNLLLCLVTVITPLPQMNTRCSFSHKSFILVIACHFTDTSNFNFEYPASLVSSCNSTSSLLCLLFIWNSECFFCFSHHTSNSFSPISQAPRPWTTPTGCLTASRPLHLSWVAYGCCICWRTCGRRWSSWTTRRRTTCDVRYRIQRRKGLQGGCMDEW